MKIRVIYGAFLLQYGIDEWVSKQRISSWDSQRCATNQMGISLGTSYSSESSYFFLWRACHEILPVRSEITRRHISSYPFCPFCHQHVETSVHALFKCHAISFIWSEGPFNMDIDLPVQNFQHLFQLLKDKLDGDTFHLACLISWKIWELRNNFVHDNMRFYLCDIVPWCRDFLHFYHTALLQVFTTTMRSIFINFDAAFPRGDSYQIDAVARDHGGRCVGWIARKFVGRPDLVVGEARAAFEALLWARFRRWNSFILDGDNLQVINSLGDKELDFLSAFSIYQEESLRVSQEFSVISCSFIG